MKCEGLPGWECGRTMIGGQNPECIVHGSLDDIQARWAQHKQPVPITKDRQTPIANARDAMYVQKMLLE